MDDITAIKNYILFLKNDCKLSVTLHPCENEQFISSSELIEFNIHENPYCIYIKNFPNARQHCIDRQKKIRYMCKNGSFCGICYAGIFEYIYPIYDGISDIGFICVSGYKSENYKQCIEKTAEKFNIPAENLLKTARCLKIKIPDKKYVDTLIIPLVKMLELAYGKSSDIAASDSCIDNVIKYINRHYSEDITLKEICSAFSYSRSSISHNFKKTIGQSVKEYLTSVRIKSAKNLLVHSKLNVTEISCAVGFNDSNYFSYIFKKHTGVSPRLYRRNNL